MKSSDEHAQRYLIRISPDAFPRLLGWVALGLVGAHVALQTFHYSVHELPWLLTDLFDVDEEESFPTWFSAILLLLSSLLLFAVASRTAHQANAFVHHWYGLALGFAVLSMDEVVGLHETLNTATDFAWTIPGAILVSGLAVFYARFVLRLPPRIRWLCIIAGAAFVGGSIGVEHIADYYIEAFETDNLGYQFMTALEESLEMVGTVVFIRALLVHLTPRGQGVVALLGIATR